MREVIRAFKALSDETRLRVLNLVLERECCVCEVMQALEISQSKASRHLSALYDAGFLNQRKEGLWSLYSVDEDMKDYLSDLVTATRKALKDNKATALDKERLKEAKRAGFNCTQDKNAGKLCSDNA
ncbi:MAG TPA: metalloregulator ArsR/SmtB family transcription factor [Dehalococcoidia bacterium]|nr:metalloregulator ArsR/SmtB family transcription factor [Dehalococcoidia bacterium]